MYFSFIQYSASIHHKLFRHWQDHIQADLGRSCDIFNAHLEKVSSPNDADFQDYSQDLLAYAAEWRASQDSVRRETGNMFYSGFVTVVVVVVVAVAALLHCCIAGGDNFSMCQDTTDTDRMPLLIASPWSQLWRKSWTMLDRSLFALSSTSLPLPLLILSKPNCQPQMLSSMGMSRAVTFARRVWVNTVCSWSFWIYHHHPVCQGQAHLARSSTSCRRPWMTFSVRWGSACLRNIPRLLGKLTWKTLPRNVQGGRRRNL